MKTLLFSIVLIFLAESSQAQAPQMFSFQGAARNASGQPVENSFINLRFKIHQTAVDGPIIYQEVKETNTTSGGLFTVDIGSGFVEAGNLDNIDWGIGSYFLSVEIDPTGGSNFIYVGVTQLLSVPYSLHANQAGRWQHNKPIIQQGFPGSGGLLPAPGVGSRLIWYPSKSAFRVGFIENDSWNDAKIGHRSVGLGSNTQSLGVASLAAGESTAALEYSSAAFGYHTVAKAVHSTVVGSYNDTQDNPFFLPEETDRIFQVGNGTLLGRSNALTVLRNGNTGVGRNVVEPQYLLDIGGRARIRHATNKTAGLFFDDSNGQPEGFVGLKSDTQIGFFNADKWSFWMDSNGNAHIAGSNYNTSDLRLKKDFSALDQSLEKLTHLRGYHYFWKDRKLDQTLQTGLIAQEVELNFPELVKTDEQGFKSVNYIGLIPYLIESVKELMAKIERLESTNELLKASNDRLTSGDAETAQGINKEVFELADLRERIIDIEAHLQNRSSPNTSANSEAK